MSAVPQERPSAAPRQDDARDAAASAPAPQVRAGRGRLSILVEEDDDPMLSAVNLVDVFLVLVVALLTAVALQQQSHADETVIRRAGQPDMEIVVRKNGQEIKYRGNGGSAEGQGERAGVAYRLKDGSIIYVPEAEAAAASAATDGSAPR